MGETPFDDKNTPRDHLVTALLTLGEGYHNFHHQFPMDYRNAIKWYQFDPTKWFIKACSWLRLASHLRVFPEGEVNKCLLTMEMKKLKRRQDSLPWPVPMNELPVIDWESCECSKLSRRRSSHMTGFVPSPGIFSFTPFDSC
jgi:stearoyl-CoA desaturase (Delta-9 desaturase)